MAVAHASTSPESRELARRMRDRYPLFQGSPHGTAKVLWTGRPEWIPDIDGGTLESIADNPEALEILLALEPRSCLSVPLKTRDRTLGAITLVSSTPDFYEDEDLALVEDLGRRAAVAIEHARLYKEKSYTARILQQSLLPPRLPRIPGYEVAATYRPAGEGNEVGGDFYDVFNTAVLGWALVMGDVCGKGPEAAELTALARYTVRTAAMSQHKPSDILETLNEAILRQRSDSRFCTIAYALLEPVRDGARLDVCCGGHPLPLVLRADGSVETAGKPGLLLGVFPEPQLSDQRVDLRPGRHHRLLYRRRDGSPRPRRRSFRRRAAGGVALGVPRARRAVHRRGDRTPRPGLRRRASPRRPGATRFAGGYGLIRRTNQ